MSTLVVQTTAFYERIKIDLICFDRFKIFTSYWNVKTDDSRVKGIENLPPNHSHDFSLCMLKVEGFIFYYNLRANS